MMRLKRILSRSRAFAVFGRHSLLEDDIGLALEYPHATMKEAGQTQHCFQLESQYRIVRGIFTELEYGRAQ